MPCLGARAVVSEYRGADHAAEHEPSGRTEFAVLLFGHMLGTFGNPLLLTMEGEFVAKNLVLLAAAFVVTTPRIDGRR